MRTVICPKCNQVIAVPDHKDFVICCNEVIYAVVDPVIYGRVWNDRWLKEYATELIRKQWGSNLSKFKGIQLPGGVTLNGGEIIQQAETEIRRLESEMENNYGGPLEIFMN